MRDGSVVPSLVAVVHKADRDAMCVELDRILAARAITPAFQPIVDLDSGSVVGFEALARGPERSILHRPDRLFAAAERAGRVDELDWLCRIRAVEAALTAGLPDGVRLFINCEPSTIGSPCPARYADLWARAHAELELVLELTERALTDRPAELSRVVAEQRDAGNRIALDDVGADVRSLALLPLVEPEIVKLDLRLVQERPSAEQAAIVSAVSAESERTGAALLAEGIEDDRHLAVARSLGATLGQGWRYGRPGPLPSGKASGAPRSRVRPPRARPPRARAQSDSPYEVVVARRVPREATKALLLPMTHYLEERARQIGEGAVVLSAFQHARHFTPATRRRYTALARGASLVAAFGVGLADEPAPGVRGAGLRPGDTLADEWSVVVIGPHFSGALVARDLGDDGRDRDRRFLFATTYDRGLVVAAAQALLGRIVAVDGVRSLAPAA